MVEYLQLVNKHNRLIGKVTRDEVIKKALPHRGVTMIVMNSKREIFVHQRTFTKDIYPGLYDIFVGGGLQYGETFRQGAIREVREELGIKNPKPIFLCRSVVKNKQDWTFSRVYKVVYDGNLRLQKAEILSGYYISTKNLEKEFKKKNFIKWAVITYHKIKKYI
jgi:isopentenyldiphosphate isomerase